MKQCIRCSGFALRGIWNCRKGYFGYSILGMIAAVFLPLALVQIPGRIIDSLLSKRQKTAVILAVLLCVVIFLNNVLTDLAKRKKVLMEESVRGYFTEQLGAHLMKIHYQKLENPETLNAYQFSVTCIDEKRTTKLVNELEAFCSSLATMLGVVYILSRLNFAVILLLVLVILANGLSEVFRMRHIYDRHKNETSAQRQLLYARNDLAKKEYAKEIRLFGLSEYVSRKVEVYAQKMCDLWKGAAIKSVKAVGWTYLLQGVQLAAVYLYLAKSFTAGAISIADFTIYSTAVIAFSTASIQVVNTFVSAANECKYIQSLMEFLGIPLPEAQTAEVKCSQPVIRFEDVSFQYPNREESAIDHLNLTIEPGVKYALVGENGAGKTTFIKLLMGLYAPTGGRITVDGTDLKMINAESYRSLFAPVFQDFHILGFQMDENIAMSREADRDRVLKAAAGMELQTVIERLPEHEKTCMSPAYAPSGTELSGGQKQKLAIARALYRDAEYIVLDEPTAALSPQSELELYESFQKITKDKGVIYISHRFASCRLCERIFVFSQGKIAEQGSHEQLMQRHGLYQEMFDLQASLYREDAEDTQDEPGEEN
jgi:ABC-type multidrug transport system, ATPase and permease components